jgi:hypothetical protein
MLLKKSIFKANCSMAGLLGLLGGYGLNREFKLWFLKLVVNVPMLVLDRFLGFPKKPEYPQTKMLLRTYRQMMKVYRLDCLQGVFGVKPDGNFERLLRVPLKSC